jgi:hypothetical protein
MRRRGPLPPSTVDEVPNAHVMPTKVGIHVFADAIS